MTEALLSVEGVSKSFPGVKALDDVSFDVRPGTVHALCGENGAGKSTLMKIINGIYQPDAGTIRVRGEEVRIKNPIDARARGIAMISQELNYVPGMTIAESFFLGRLPMKFGKVDWRFIRTEARRILAEEGLDFSINRRLGTLTVSEIQTLEILRAVYHSADVLIMDEPTSAIAHKEVESLFAKIRDLRAQGKSIIYISHKMDEVFELADDISVLRDGTVVSSQPASEITSSQVIAQMVGRDLDHQSYPKERVEIGDTVFRATGLSAEHMFEDIDLHIRAGEIVGLAGLIGAGRSEVARAVFGVDGYREGSVRMEGRRIRPRRPVDAMRAGLALVPEDRRKQGLVIEAGVGGNITLAIRRRLARLGLLTTAMENRAAREWASRLEVKTHALDTVAATLSGGNQQKVVLAKWLATQPQVLLIDEPTRGIDVGTKSEVHRLLSQLAGQGMGILMISSELPEVLGMADRVLVMREGRITAEIPRSEATSENVMFAATHASELSS